MHAIGTIRLFNGATMGGGEIITSVVKNTLKKCLSNYSHTFKIKYLKYHTNTIYSKVI